MTFWKSILPFCTQFGCICCSHCLFGMFIGKLLIFICLMGACSERYVTKQRAVHLWPIGMIGYRLWFDWGYLLLLLLLLLWEEYIEKGKHFLIYGQHTLFCRNTCCLKIYLLSLYLVRFRIPLTYSVADGSFFCLIWYFIWTKNRF